MGEVVAFPGRTAVVGYLKPPGERYVMGYAVAFPSGITRFETLADVAAFLVAYECAPLPRTARMGHSWLIGVEPLFDNQWLELEREIEAAKEVFLPAPQTV